jgi:hypothetical protein
MDKQGMYSNLNFNHPPTRLASKIIAIFVILAVFTFLWLVVPRAFLYWILVIPLACLSWAATYGIRSAISDLIKLLKRLENI